MAAGQVSPLGLTPMPDAAGNNCEHQVNRAGPSSSAGISDPAERRRLDGTLGVVAALEALRRYGRGPKAPVTLRLVGRTKKGRFDAASTVGGRGTAQR